MKLTPLDIHHKEFHRAMRGYSEAEVDVFLDQVADEFERIFKENLDSKEQIEKMLEKVKQYEGQEQTLQKALFMAQQAADNVQQKAAEESEVIIKDAETRALEVIEDAINQKQDLQKDIENLRKAEKEFRSKFKELLDSYLDVISKVDKNESKAEVTEAKPESPVIKSAAHEQEAIVEAPGKDAEQSPAAASTPPKEEAAREPAAPSVPKVTIGEPKHQDETPPLEASAKTGDSDAVVEGKTDEFDFFGSTNFFEQGPRDFPAGGKQQRPTRPGWQPTSESVTGLEPPTVPQPQTVVGEAHPPANGEVARKVSNFFEEDLGADDDAKDDAKDDSAGQRE